MRYLSSVGVILVALTVAVSTAAAASTPQEKCHIGKTKEVGKYASCLAKAYAKLATSADQNRFDARVAKCNSKFQRKFAKYEEKAEKKGATCLSVGDDDEIVARTEKWAGAADHLTGASDRFIDNGDGTVSDPLTGLMWEQKSGSGIREIGTLYTWSVSEAFPDPDGTAFSSFLATLNGGATGVGSCLDYAPGGPGGFAGYCDWRLPTVEELQTILPLSFGGSPLSCWPFVSYLTADSVDSSGATNVWVVNDCGTDPAPAGKAAGAAVRAVRGGRCPLCTSAVVGN